MEDLHLWRLLQALVLIAVANGTPILAKFWLGDRCAQPLDAGLRLWDGEPLFGKSKTIRGLLLAMVTAALTSAIMGLGLAAGAVAGAAAMVGDLVSSFTKRRLGLKPSSMAPGLDQVPEALLPLVAIADRLQLSTADVVVGVAAFWIGEVVLSRVLFALSIRDRPY
jgi:CDP-2,3-bis-(O-geranylgeranyl)-sn-glycerol synthase